MTLIDHAGVIELLKTTPRRIALATQGMSDGELTAKPTADSWSVTEILAHLRSCADVWGESIDKILKQDNPAFRHVSPRGWIKKTNYLELEFSTSFVAFKMQRERFIETLQALPQKDWARRANVRAASTVRVETVLSYAQRLAEHESGHCGQIDRVLRELERAPQLKA